VRKRAETSKRIRVLQLNPKSNQFEDSDVSPEQFFEKIEHSGEYHATEFEDGSIACLTGNGYTYSITIFP
jgi:hypothetical protein